MKPKKPIVFLLTAALAACAIGSAAACEDGMLVDYGGQSCYEGWNEYGRAQPLPPEAPCPDWHDETPGALGEHCPLVQAEAAPQTAPDWHEEAPRLLQALDPPPPDRTLEATANQYP